MAKTRYTPWEIRDFSAGQVEKLNDNILPDNAAHECRNFISSRLGGLSKRKGQTKLNTIPLPAAVQGTHPYYSRASDIRRIIAVSQGLGYLWDGTGFVILTYSGAESLVGDLSFPLIGTALWGEIMLNHPDAIFPLDPSAITMFEDCVNYVISMNGVDAPWKWDGSVLTFLANAPAKGRYPVLHKEKLFCVNTAEPSTLRWSASFDPESWPAPNYWDISKGDGDDITCLLKFVDDLLIFKNRSIHALKGTSLDDFSLQEISDKVGCVGPRAAVVHDLKVFFVSEYGLYVTNGMNVLNISEMVIPDTWARINKTYLHKTAMTVWDDLIWISMPIDSSSINNFLLVYDPKKQSFWPMTVIGASCYIYYNDGTGDGVKLYAGSPTAGYIHIGNEGYTDCGVAVDALWRGKYFDMGTPEIEKKSRKLFVQDSPDTTEVVTVSVSVDYGSYNNLTYNRTDGLTREYLFNTDSNRWRYVSPMIAHTSTGECEVRGIVIPYKPKRDLGVRE